MTGTEERGGGRGLVRADPHEALVSPLELFFDLVFVFALTQVTAFLAEDPTFAQLGRGLLILALIWWAWSGYTWLTSTVDPELGLPRLVMFAAMGAMLVVALATPGAFEDDGLLWGLGYLAVRLLHAALFALAARGDPHLARVVLSLVRSLIPGAGLIILASVAFEGTARDVLWVLAVVLDYGLVLAAGAEGWHVHARHFAERFGLVMIIAFGESIVAIGVGAEGIELGLEAVVAALLAAGIVCALWWAYFDVAAVVAEERFTAAEGAAQLRMARDSYALLHLPMIAGVVLFALGVKKVLEHTGDPLEGHARGGALRRRRALPARPRRVPDAQRRHAQRAPDRRGGRLPRADPGGHVGRRRRSRSRSSRRSAAC